MLLADAGEDVTSVPGEAITLGGIPAATGGTQPYTYSWSPGVTLSNPQTEHPEWTIDTNDVTFTLTVRDANNCTASDEVVVLIDLTTSTAPDEEPFTVYPNPAAHWLIVRTGIGNDQTLQLSDQKGLLLLSEQANPNEHRLDIRSLANGIYFLTLEDGHERKAVKILISR